MKLRRKDGMKPVVIIAATVIIPVSTAVNALQPQPLPKQGSCPGGYSQSGGYCLASSGRSRLALPKSGSCPAGFSQSGDYCLSAR